MDQSAPHSLFLGCHAKRMVLCVLKVNHDVGYDSCRENVNESCGWNSVLLIIRWINTGCLPLSGVTVHHSLSFRLLDEVGFFVPVLRNTTFALESSFQGHTNGSYPHLLGQMFKEPEV